MSHITPVGDKLLNAKDDIDWLFDTHLKDFPEWKRKTKSFILSGNEDAPSAIILMAKKEPLVSDSGEAVFMPDFYSGDIVLKTKRGGMKKNPRRAPLSAHAAAIMGAKRKSAKREQWDATMAEGKRRTALARKKAPKRHMYKLQMQKRGVASWTTIHEGPTVEGLKDDAQLIVKGGFVGKLRIVR